MNQKKGGTRKRLTNVNQWHIFSLLHEFEGNEKVLILFNLCTGIWNGSMEDEKEGGEGGRWGRKEGGRWGRTVLSSLLVTLMVSN